MLFYPKSYTFEPSLINKKKYQKMKKKNFYKLLSKLGFEGCDKSLEISLVEYGQVYSEKMSWLISNVSVGSKLKECTFHLATNIDACEINEKYADNKENILKMDGGFEPQRLFDKLSSVISYCGNEWGVEELTYSQLCEDLQKMLFWQNSIKVTEAVEKIGGVEISVEEENFFQLGHIDFRLYKDTDAKGIQYTLYFQGLELHQLRIDGIKKECCEDGTEKMDVLEYIQDLT